MKNKDFLCPKCKGNLRVEEYIILSAKDKDKDRGLILLSPELGNYEVHHHPDFDISGGNLVDFYCPLCHKRITSKQHKNLAWLIMRDQEGQEYDILFSQIRGEQCTFKVLGKHTESFGKDAHQYLQFLHRV
ncbi:MAG: hypothetical protein K9I94_07380 [Bacteroidales bacterium]|nr:hypothetical protein [Bacteroidales bacterium]